MPLKDRPEEKTLLVSTLQNVRDSRLKLGVQILEAEEVLDAHMLEEFSEHETFVDLKRAIEDARILNKSFDNDLVVDLDSLRSLNFQGDVSTSVGLVVGTATLYKNDMEQLISKLNKTIDEFMVVVSKEQ